MTTWSWIPILYSFLEKNDIFNNIVQRGKDDWELGKDQNFEDVMENTTVKYNNMVKQKIWTQTNPKDAKILALTTLNHELQNSKKAGNLIPAQCLAVKVRRRSGYSPRTRGVLLKKIPPKLLMARFGISAHIIKEKENTTECMLHIRRISTTNGWKENPVGARRNLLLLPLHQHQKLLLQPRYSL